MALLRGNDVWTVRALTRKDSTGHMEFGLAQDPTANPEDFTWTTLESSLNAQHLMAVSKFTSKKATLFTRQAIHEPIHSVHEYTEVLPADDPSVVNWPSHVNERIDLYKNIVLQQALADDAWTYEPIGPELLVKWLLPCPEWKVERASYFNQTKQRIFNELLTMLLNLQSHVTGADEDALKAPKTANRATKKTLSFQGFNIAIEYPQGSTRRGTAPDGTKWEREVTYHYGYIKKTEANDGDNMDVYVGPDDTSDHVFIVNQLQSDGSFDEHKVLLGFNTPQEAMDGYLENMPDDWTQFRSLRGMTLPEFRHWIHVGDVTKVAKAIEIPQGLIDTVIKSWVIPFIVKTAQGVSDVEWDRMVEAKTAVWVWDIKGPVEHFLPDFFQKTGLSSVHIRIGFVTDRSWPEFLVVDARETGSGVIQILLAKLDRSVIIEHFPPEVLEDMEQALVHEFAHMIQGYHQGWEARNTQVRKLQPLSNPGFINHNYEVKALSAELCATYQTYLKTDPNLTIDDFLQGQWQWPKIKERMDVDGQQTILKDLAFTQRSIRTQVSGSLRSSLVRGEYTGGHIVSASLQEFEDGCSTQQRLGDVTKVATERIIKVGESHDRTRRETQDCTTGGSSSGNPGGFAAGDVRGGNLTSTRLPADRSGSRHHLKVCNSKGIPGTSPGTLKDFLIAASKSSRRFTHFKLALPSVELFCRVGDLWHKVVYRSSYPLKAQNGQLYWVCSCSLEVYQKGVLPSDAKPITGSFGIKASLFTLQGIIKEGGSHDRIRRSPQDCQTGGNPGDPCFWDQRTDGDNRHNANCGSYRSRIHLGSSGAPSPTFIPATKSIYGAIEDYKEFQWNAFYLVGDTAFYTSHPKGYILLVALKPEGWMGMRVSHIPESYKSHKLAKSFEPQDIPKNFWAAVRFNPDDISDFQRGTLIGVKGISSSPEIIYEFLEAGNRAFIRMPGEACVAGNQLSRVMYDTPAYLMSKNMTALRRILGVGTPINALEYLAGRTLGLSLSRLFDFTAFLRKQEIPPINTEADFLKVLLQLAKDYNATDPNSRAEFPVLADPSQIALGLNRVLEQCMNNYGHENEWILKNNTLHIPQGSHIGIMLPMGYGDVAPAMARYTKIVEMFNGDAEKASYSRDLTMDDRMLVLYVSEGLKLQDSVESKYTVGFVTPEKFQHRSTELLQRNRAERRQGVRPGYQGVRRPAVTASKTAAPNPEAYAAWFERMGGWDGIDGLWGDGWQDAYWEQAAESVAPKPSGPKRDAKIKEVARGLIRQDLARAYEDWSYKYKHLIRFPLHVYRAVSLDTPQDLTTSGIGVYWTDSESHAQAHWGGGQGQTYILHATITEDAVDWDGTIVSNMDPSLGEDEQEIRLKPGAYLTLLGFKEKSHGFHGAPEWHPLQAEAVA